MSNTIPNWRDRQETLYGRNDVSSAQLEAYAKQCVESGMLELAIAFATKAKSESMMRMLKATAISDGDAFLALSLEREGQRLDADEWAKLKDFATLKGKIQFAQWADKRLGKTDTNPS